MLGRVRQQRIASAVILARAFCDVRWPRWVLLAVAAVNVLLLCVCGLDPALALDDFGQLDTTPDIKFSDGPGYGKRPGTLGQQWGAQVGGIFHRLPTTVVGTALQRGVAQGLTPEETEQAALVAGFTPEQAAAKAQAAAQVPDVPIKAARQKFKDAGLADYKLPDQPSIKQPVLDMMLDDALEETKRQITIARGPQGFIPNALWYTTSFLLPMIDPANMAALLVGVWVLFKTMKYLYSSHEQARWAEQVRRREQVRREEEARQRQQEQAAAERVRAEQQEQARTAEQARRREQTRREEEARQRQQEQTLFRQRPWWEVLGVAPSATPDDVQRAYRHKVKQYHPDKLVTLAPELIQLAEMRTKELNRAFSEAKRAEELNRTFGEAKGHEP